jgi:hypothetical protein
MADVPFADEDAPPFVAETIERKKRRKRTPRPDPMPRNITISLEKALEITSKVKDEDGMLLLEIVRLLNTVSKRSRRRITQALGQLFK